MDVRCTGKGQEALRLIREAAQAGRPFRLALLDMHMPQMDGIELVRQIRTLPGADTTGLLMLRSTYADIGQSSRTDRRTVRYLGKPIRRGELLFIISGMLAPDPLGSTQPTAAPDLPGTYAGRRVLLVEDSPINQYIAAEMLRRLGLAVNLAANGAEAVDLVRANGYDLVLMDCHMPHMDGFAATRHIRAWESIAAERPPLPIVALTANAMDGDREACIEAGMSDYLSKPITGAELAAMVARHLSAHKTAMPDRPGRPAAAPPTDQGTPPPPAPVFDTTRLESLPMVIDGSNPSFATQVLEQFLDIGADTLAQFERATQAGDRRTQFRCVHTLKSSSAQIGLDAMAVVAQTLEQVLRAGGSPDADAVRQLQEEHHRARRAIAAHLGHEITTQESSG